jgi:V8-like Glu-specific endopeptidase
MDRVLTDYKLMTPCVIRPYTGNLSISKDEEKKVNEVLTAEDTLRNMSFFLRAIQIANPVCSIRNKGAGTGFLIGKKFVLTNHHVLESIGGLDGCIFRFNFQLDANNLLQPIEEYIAEDNGVLHTKGDPLDYAIIELKEKAGEKLPGEKWGYISLKPVPTKRGQRVNIIQHPGGLEKHICVQHNFVEDVRDPLIQYLTSTMKGSSGSPVFDDTWGIVALHHGGGMLRQPDGETTHYRNEGTLISAILKDLPSNIAQKVVSM